MYYLKILFFNFLIVFFANYFIPGIEVTSTTKLPHIGSDLIFSLILGLLNSLIYPLLKIVGNGPSTSRIALIALILNFGAYGLIKFLPLGIHLASIEGYLIVSLVVSVGSFLTNFFEMKHGKPEEPQE